MDGAGDSAALARVLVSLIQIRENLAPVGTGFWTHT